MMKIPIICLVLVAGSSSTCQNPNRPVTTSASTTSGTPEAKSQKKPSDIDRELINLATDYSSTDANKQTQAWKALMSSSLPELTSNLNRLRDKSTKGGVERVAIAFTLCSLDIEYVDNKQVILDAFLTKPHNKNLHSDWQAGLIGRLINRGDRLLLPIVFNAAAWSDGALSEELAGIYLNSWRKDPEAFLTALQSVPANARRDVYLLLLTDQVLTSEDRAKMKSYLTTATQHPSMGSIAKEMLAVLSKPD
jgi:hypothetical protein